MCLQERQSRVDEMAQEYMLLQRVMEYLIHSEQTLIVMEEAQPDQEGNTDITQRTIVLNPNYVIE